MHDSLSHSEFLTVAPVWHPSGTGIIVETTNLNQERSDEVCRVKFNAICAHRLQLLRRERGRRYPDQPIRMIVGFAPGGGTDTTARAISASWREAARPAGHRRQPRRVLRAISPPTRRAAAPDGYTLLMGTIAALAINPSLYRTTAVRSGQGFRAHHPGGGFDEYSVAASYRCRRKREGADRARQGQPGKLALRLVGRRRRRHLAGVLFNQFGRHQNDHVPYKRRRARDDRSRERRGEPGFRDRRVAVPRSRPAK